MNIHSRDLRSLPRPARPPLTFADRLQRMLRHPTLILTGAVLLAAGMIALVLYIQSRPTTLKIAVGPRSSEDYRVVQALAAHLSRERANIRVSVLRENGAAESADAIERGAADLAVVRRDLAMPKNGQVIAVQRRNVAVLIVPPPPQAAPATKKGRKGKPAPKTDGKQKPITKIEDLNGKTIAVIGRTPANAALLDTILAQYGIAPNKVEKLHFSTEDLTTQLRAAKFDALLAVGPIGSKITAEAIAALARGTEQPVFLEISSSEAIEQQKPVYESTEIPAGAFGGSKPPEAIETIGFSHYIVARRTLDEKLAGDFTRALFAAKQALGGDLPAFTKIESPDTDKAATLAVHPGALAYLEGEQKGFFERYSEPLYWGLMLMSFFGSGAAWLVSYARTSSSSGGGDRNDLEGLIGIVPRARTAVSATELDSMQSEIDEIVERVIRQMEGGEIEQNRSAAFTLAAEEARRAIVEQRVLLKA